MAELAESKPLLQLRGICKSFPGVRATHQATLLLRAGEIHALVGENGAGKSTLIKILAGIHQPDAGSISINGREMTLPSPAQSLGAGIAVIHQEFALVPTLSVQENLFLGREKARLGMILRSEERAEALALLKQLGGDILPETLCRDLSVAGQQVVEIARALSRQAKVLIMDEPTAALSERETERLFALMRQLRDQGTAILYVSHRLDEIMALCDRATVMRDGETVASSPIAELSRQKLIELMVGRAMESEFPPRTSAVGNVYLRVQGLRRGRSVRGVSFEARRGEILGIAGLVGSGRTEVARLIFGADKPEAGTMTLNERPFSPASPQEAIERGVALLTEDRKHQGLVLGLSVRENFTLPNLRFFSKIGFVTTGSERKAFDHYAQELQIKIPHREQKASRLSGGNQQKVVLAKWLQANAEIIIFDEPTRGVDVGAKYEIYRLMDALAAAGKCVIAISSELPEILGISDRLLVMQEGQISGEISHPQSASQADVMKLATH